MVGFEPTLYKVWAYFLCQLGYICSVRLARFELAKPDILNQYVYRFHHKRMSTPGEIRTRKILLLRQACIPIPSQVHKYT